jgi:hypothetical protein
VGTVMDFVDFLKQDHQLLPLVALENWISLCIQFGKVAACVHLFHFRLHMGISLLLFVTQLWISGATFDALACVLLFLSSEGSEARAEAEIEAEKASLAKLHPMT